MNKNCPKKYIWQAIFAFLIAGLFIIPGSANLIDEIQKEARQAMNDSGSTIYVDDDNTAGPWEGTVEHPYRFIQDGIDAAVGGDTVFVFNGTYFENIVITVSLTLAGESTESTFIDGKGFGTVLNIFAEGVTVTGFTISHCGSNPNNAGILIHTPYNVISENNIQHNYYFGIWILERNNTIYHNNFVKNTYQAFDEVAGSTWDNGYPSGGNYWSDYTGTDENEDGIGEIPVPTGNSSSDRYPLVHSYGSITNEETHMNFLTIQRAIEDNTTLSGHHIRVKPGAYYEHVCIKKTLSLYSYSSYVTYINGRYNGTIVTITSGSVTLSGFTISGSGNGTRDAGIMINASNCYIRDNLICYNFQGVILTSTAMNNQITRNMIDDNRWNGLVLEPGSKGNSIVENSISDSYYAGVAISETTGNYLYHNNFRNNRYHAYDDGTNVWDDGYPSGGNYWSDYAGSDANGDGIGDTPYAIPDGINTDRYPLMAPYTNEDTIPPMVKIVLPEKGLYLWGLHLLSWLFRQSTIIMGAITIQVEASDAQSGIEKVEFFIDDDDHPEFTDTEAPYSWRWSQGFLLQHKHTVIVVAYDNAGNPNYDMIEVKKYI